MAKSPAERSHLSNHLLQEAQRFTVYPTTASRKDKKVGTQALFDGHWRDFVEWQRTFTPATAPNVPALAFETRFLDDFYSRELLRAVPDLVSRTQRLSRLSLAGAPKDSFEYLREASQAYICGLPNAAIALSRAAIEVRFRKVAAKLFGIDQCRGREFAELFEDYGARLLSAGALQRAKRVRTRANTVLHESPDALDTAFDTVESARLVVLELSRK